MWYAIIWWLSSWSSIRSFETRKIPALEWLAVKLENLVHSIGLCPEWNCCAPDGGLSPDHPSLQNRTTSRGATRGLNHPFQGNNSRQATHQFRGHFHRLANSSNSNGSTTATTVNTNTSLRVNVGKADNNGLSTKPAVNKVNSSDTSVQQCDDPIPATSRSQWV